MGLIHDPIHLVGWRQCHVPSPQFSGEQRGVGYVFDMTVDHHLLVGDGGADSVGVRYELGLPRFSEPGERSTDVGVYASYGQASVDNFPQFGQGDPSCCRVVRLHL